MISKNIFLGNSSKENNLNPTSDREASPLENRIASEKILLDSEESRSGAKGIFITFETIDLCDGDFQEASLLSLFHYWLQNEKNGKYFKGFRWIYKSAADLVKNCFISLSRQQIARTLASLVDKNFLIREQLHFDVNQDYSWANRTYYYRIDYSTISEKMAENLTSSRLLKNKQSDCSDSINQIAQNQTIYNTKNTSRKNDFKNSPPNPPESTREGEEKEKEKEESNTFSPSQKLDKPEIKTDKSRIKKEESADVVLNIENRLQKETNCAPWRSLEELNAFYTALVKALPIVANARNADAVAKTIVRDMKRGEPCSYWEDFKNGDPIGFSTKQEWEVEPGVVYPMFVEYLAETIKDAHDGIEKARLAALKILDAPQKAKGYWEMFKRVFVRVGDNVKSQLKLGVSTPNTPVWMRERVEPTLEEMKDAAKVINGNENQSYLAPAESLSLPKMRSLPKREPIKTRPCSKIHVNKMTVEQINEALQDPIMVDQLAPQLELSEYWEVITRDRFGRILEVVRSRSVPEG
jgi:hypothetical protein